MITLDLNTSGKIIKFSYAVANVHPEDISGKFIMDFGDSNVSFPIKLSDNNIVVELRTNNLFIANSFGKIIKSRLEIIAGRDTFIVPWNGEVKINRTTKNIKSNKSKKPKSVYKEQMKEEVIDKDNKYLLEEKIKMLRSKIKSDIEEDENDFDDNLTEENTKNNFSDFLNTPIEEIIFTKEEIDKRKKNREIIENILNLSIGENKKKKKKKFIDSLD